MPHCRLQHVARLDSVQTSKGTQYLTKQKEVLVNLAQQALPFGQRCLAAKTSQRLDGHHAILPDRMVHSQQELLFVGEFFVPMQVVAAVLAPFCP